ncbi:MAG TPA: SPOR domain-containing protein [Methyloceanibacter sp.]|nr:SPOR domain-containing protein [Methyloceanibacter sp.]
MADQRKSFRARRLAFGGRTLLCLLAATVLAGAAAAQAQEAGLKNGAASLAAGKYSDAVRQLSAAINSEGATPGVAAKALYLRGIAYRKLGEPARAAADLGAAVWLGLPEPERVKALVNRGLAYRTAGLSKQAEAELASARTIGGNSEVDKLIAEGGGSTESAASVAAFSTEVRPEGQETASNEGSSWFPSLSRFRNRSGTPAPAPQPEPAPTRTASASPQWTTTTSKPGETEAPSAWSTSVAGADQPSSTSSATRSGNRFTRWFGSVSDSSPSPAPAPAPQPAPATQTAAATPQPSKPPAAAASSSWSTTTENPSADAGGGEKKSSWRIFGRSAEAEPAAESAAQASGFGGYQLQLANSRSEGEANALWKKISQSQGLSGVSHEIEKIEIGNFGTFYSLKIGPFPDKAQSVKVCNALKRNGIDCLPATL